MNVSAIIEAAGGKAEVARLCERDPNSITYWIRRGCIPGRHVPTIIAKVGAQVFERAASRDTEVA